MLLQHMHIGLKYMGPLQCAFGVPSTLLVWDFWSFPAGKHHEIKIRVYRPRTSLITSIMGWSSIYVRALQEYRQLYLLQCRNFGLKQYSLYKKFPHSSHYLGTADLFINS